MRKTAFLTAVIVCLCLSAVGCGEKPDTDNTPSTTTTTTTTTTQNTSPYISEEQAIAAAEAYFTIENESVDEQTGHQFFYWVMQTPTEEDPRYKVALQWRVVEDGHLSTLDFVWIDAVTGEAHYET